MNISLDFSLVGLQELELAARQSPDLQRSERWSDYDSAELVDCLCELSDWAKVVGQKDLFVVLEHQDSDLRID